MSIGHFPRSLSQRILAGIILVGTLGVNSLTSLGFIGRANALSSYALEYSMVIMIIIIMIMIIVMNGKLY